MRKGTRQDALKFSLGANQANGLRRTNADKRHCVELALKEFPKLSKAKIAELCGVDDHTVAAVRSTFGISEPEKVTGKDGKEYPATRKAGPVAAFQARQAERATAAGNIPKSV